MSLGENSPAVTGERISDYAATWEGYTEAFSFPSGTDRVRLTLAEDGTGTLTVGEDAPLPPVPTNPDVGPGFDDPGAGPIFEGFPYSVHATRVEERRILLGAKVSEPFKPWCELQTSYQITSSYYTCLPDMGETRMPSEGDCSYKLRGEDELMLVDCEKLSICRDNLICECDATGCSVKLTENLEDMTLRLDGALAAEGNELVGTLVVIYHGREAGRPTVRFTRN